MKTAVIYARYSSDNQTEQSIEGQIRVCGEYAQRNNILILATYIDRAMTGTNDNRPDFKRMMKDSEKREWDYILVTKKLKSCKFAFRVIRMRRQIIFLRLRSKFISTKSFVSSSVLKYGRRPSYTAFFRLYFGSNKCSRLIYQTALFARPEANRRVFP